MLLENRTIIVTGAASPRGIGKATARALAAQGANVVILDLRREDAQSAAAELGAKHLGLACDVTNKDACIAAARETLQRFGRIDGLVNNAGITQPVRTLEIGGKDFDAIVDVNLRGTLYMSQAVLPAMKEQNGGSIVCMSSVSAQRGGGIFGGPHYSAAKAGVLGLAKAMAREFGANHIRVNSITPGLIHTDITGDKLTPAMREDIIKGIPLGRLGDAADVANACLFLLSDLSSYLTGITLDVNGGMLIH
ncbi:SDR family NAD(P)-dependent oxidoreductase [Paraburkholderia youngii]|uniref:NAD(P)-dependent dehydrogenase (Short-subunit alcohol dehydrogenase family) n=1 Tax=Paraburkholderia youngii TaxID=2782701 RepID=A0A7W8L8Z8_9BURK|nr:SDR family NAD(P)-dependent oxidoreductase [Paraburkholderia youngii]MBB5402310.1 NAD(P)-dependent dehydrogenase (short-subunit alcohol dehydrogenase family) [Paraburkholderia youngii]